MNLPLYIARRYLLARKSHNAINIISLISVCGVATATLATVCVLSVLNGFENLVADMFSSFDPQLKITPLQGKTFDPTAARFADIAALPEVESVAESLEDNVLLGYRGRHSPAILKGVSDNFTETTDIASILLDGEARLTDGDSYRALLGVNLANKIGVTAAFAYPMEVFAPRRTGRINPANPATAYNKEYIFIGGVFQVKQAKYDENCLIAPIAAARALFDCENEVSALEIALKPDASVEKAKKKIEALAGSAFEVKDRYRQQEETFRMIEIEKWVSFLILCFILLIAAFNIIGSLSMLIIDKQADVETLRKLGADNRLVSRIFLFEGWLISAAGALVGIALGALLCLGQQYFGWLKLGTEGSFAVDAYPVELAVTDLLLVFAVALVIGFLSVWYPVRFLTKNRVLETQ